MLLKLHDGFWRLQMVDEARPRQTERTPHTRRESTLLTAFVLYFLFRVRLVFFKELRESKTSVLMSAIQVGPRLFSR